MARNIILIAEEGELIGEQKLIDHYLTGQMTGNQWQMADGSRWDIRITGVGALNILRSLRDLPRETRLLNIGYAGSANFPVGSAVVVSEVRLNHPCVAYREPQLFLEAVPDACLRDAAHTLHALCYSNTDFVLASDYRDCVFDMELAYIAGMGFPHTAALKIVSDNLNLHDYRRQAAQ